MAARRWHEDPGEVSGVVEPRAVQVVLWTSRSATVQLYNTNMSQFSSVHRLCVLVAQRLERQTFDQALAGSIPERVVIKSPRSTQPYIPPG